MSSWQKLRRSINNQGMVRGSIASVSRFFYKSAIRVLLKKRRPFEPMPVDLASVKTILIVKFFGLGNMTLFTPALQSIRKSLPDARVVLVTDGHGIPVIQNCNYFDEAVIIKPNAFEPSRELFTAIRKIKLEQPDLIITSYPSFQSQVSDIYDGLGARWSIGHDVDGHPSKFSQQLTHDPCRHEVENNLDLLRALGFSEIETKLKIEFAPRDLVAADEFLNWQRGGPPWFAFSCGSYPDMMARRWPAEHFAQLGDRLTKRHGGRVVICGDKSERPLAEKIAAMMDNRAVVAAGELSILETAALLSKCKLMVSNDSGLMHIGAAVGVPVAALFGPTSDLRGAPWTEKGKSLVLKSDTECAPCHKTGIRIVCASAKCMRKLSVDEVDAAIQSSGLTD